MRGRGGGGVMWMLWREVSGFILFPLLQSENKEGKVSGSLCLLLFRESNGGIFSVFILSAGN